MMRKMNDFPTSVTSSPPNKGLHHLHHQEHHDIEQSPRRRSRSSSQDFLLTDKNESHSSLSIQHSQAVLNERWWKFAYLVGGIMFFFGLHNYMQELIMRQPGFKVRHFFLASLFIYHIHSLHFS
jgi:hypothetical protein